MKTLAWGLEAADRIFKKNLNGGWVPNTKKYKRIHTYVTKKSKIKDNVSFQDSE